MLLFLVVDLEGERRQPLPKLFGLRLAEQGAEMDIDRQTVVCDLLFFCRTRHSSAKIATGATVCSKTNSTGCRTYIAF